MKNHLWKPVKPKEVEGVHLCKRCGLLRIRMRNQRTSYSIKGVPIIKIDCNGKA